MDDTASIPSISTGQVGSRFVSQEEIDSAKQRREEQWRAAYARLGQEPPPQPVEEVYDGRSLAEKLAANRAAKQEEWEEKTKLANQFRALEEDEIMFLDSVREKQEAEERQRKLVDSEEIRSFKEAVAARNATSNVPPKISSTATSKSKPAAPTQVKKDPKKSLKGVLVKKKPIKDAASAEKAKETTASQTKPSPVASSEKRKRSEDESPKPAPAESEDVAANSDTKKAKLS